MYFQSFLRCGRNRTRISCNLIRDVEIAPVTILVSSPEVALSVQVFPAVLPLVEFYLLPQLLQARGYHNVNHLVRCTVTQTRLSLLGHSGTSPGEMYGYYANNNVTQTRISPLGHERNEFLVQIVAQAKRVPNLK